MRLVLLVAAVLLPGVAWADTHAVTIRNGSGEIIRGIYFDGGSESRLRRELPAGTEARITYSTRCRTDIRIAYASGRTEDHAGVDACSDPHLVAGQDGTAGPAMSPGAFTTAAGPGPKLVTTVAPRAANLAPPPVVPPWTGKSITKRFGGME